MATIELRTLTFTSVRDLELALKTAERRARDSSVLTIIEFGDRIYRTRPDEHGNPWTYSYRLSEGNEYMPLRIRKLLGLEIA